MKRFPTIRSRMRRWNAKAFTLIELLVSMTILSVMLLMLSQLLDQVQKTWNYSEGRISQFREARIAFDIISKNLAQASLNTYWDYDYEPSSNTVKNYKRQSELHFLTLEGRELGSSKDGEIISDAIFFQAPLGVSNVYRNLSNLFTARGYYLVFGGDERFKPSIIGSDESYRFRLMEYRPPAEWNQIYIDGDEERLANMQPVYSEWYKYKLSEYSNPLAENIIALIISPRDTLEVANEAQSASYSRIARDYNFDSNEHTDPRFVQQVPPLVRVTLVAIDEGSAVRLEAINGTSMPRLVPNTLFKSTANFEDDVEKLKEDLSEQNINHKVFSTMVAIRSAKWSTIVP